MFDQGTIADIVVATHDVTDTTAAITTADTTGIATGDGAVGGGTAIVIAASQIAWLGPELKQIVLRFGLARLEG